MQENFRKYIIAFILIIVIMISTSCTKSNLEKDTASKIQVAVSIVPEEAFVKAVAGDLIDVVVMIPPGGSHTNYQPTPKQMNDLGHASVYFAIGVETEIANILPNMDGVNKDIEVVHLEEIVDAMYPPRYFGDEEIVLGDTTDTTLDSEHDHVGRDPHIWMSPKRVIVMIEAIRDKLVEIDPSNTAVYTKNATEYIKLLEEQNRAIMGTIEALPNKSFIIMHPSLGYFADDYGLEMLAIEEDGKATTARRLQDIIDFANEADIKVIFYQAEFDSQQAKTIAEEIDGETIELDIMALDYLSNLEAIESTFSKVLE